MCGSGGGRWYGSSGTRGGCPRCGWPLGGLASSGVGVVAVRIRLLVGGRQLLVVGRALGLGAWWVLQPPQVVVLPVHGLWAGGVEGRALVVAAGLVLLVLVVVVVVLLVVVVMVIVLVVLLGLVVVVVVVVVVLGLVLVVVLGVLVVAVLRVCP